MVKAQSPPSMFLALWIENPLYQGHDFRPTQTLNQESTRGEVAGHFVGGIDDIYHIIWCHYMCVCVYISHNLVPLCMLYLIV